MGTENNKMIDKILKEDRETFKSIKVETVLNMGEIMDIFNALMGDLNNKQISANRVNMCLDQDFEKVRRELIEKFRLLKGGINKNE